MSRSPAKTGGLLLGGPMLNLLTIVAGMLAAYFLTVQSLRLDLAAKAEEGVVAVLDKKLTTIEVMLREGVVNREDFYRFSKDIEARLTRIELYLTEKPGDQRGTIQ